MKKSPILFVIGIIGIIGVFLASPKYNILNTNFAYIFIPMMCTLLLAFIEWWLEHFDESIFKILLEKKK